MNQSYFVQDCPTCGRSLRIRVQYLGRELTCQHCRGKLEAREPDTRAQTKHSGLALVRRANQLLDKKDAAAESKIA